MQLPEKYKENFDVSSEGPSSGIHCHRQFEFQLCFNFNRIHDSVGKALRTSNQGRMTANSHALSSSFHPGYSGTIIYFFIGRFLWVLLGTRWWSISDMLKFKASYTKQINRALNLGNK
jgi:hypothetical protein